jgi:hypothetical protein
MFKSIRTRRDNRRRKQRWTTIINATDSVIIPVYQKQKILFYYSSEPAGNINETQGSAIEIIGESERRKEISKKFR